MKALSTVLIIIFAFITWNFFFKTDNNVNKENPLPTETSVEILKKTTPVQANTEIDQNFDSNQEQKTDDKSEKNFPTDQSSIGEANFKPVEQFSENSKKKIKHIDDEIKSLKVLNLKDVLGGFSKMPKDIPVNDKVRSINGNLEANTYFDGTDINVVFHFASTAGNTKEWPHRDSCLIINAQETKPFIYSNTEREYKIYRSKSHPNHFIIIADPWYLQVVTRWDNVDLRLRANLYRNESSTNISYIGFLSFYEMNTGSLCPY